MVFRQTQVQYCDSKRTHWPLQRCKFDRLSVGPLPMEQNTSEALFQILFIVAIVAVLAFFILVVILFINVSR